MLFTEQVEQADLPGIEGDFGVLSGQHRLCNGLRRRGSREIRGVGRSRGVLAESASPVADFDLSDLKVQIEEMQESLAQKSAGDELDQAIALLDHYTSTQVMLSSTAAF